MNFVQSCVDLNTYFVTVCIFSDFHTSKMSCKLHTKGSHSNYVLKFPISNQYIHFPHLPGKASNSHHQKEMWGILGTHRGKDSIYQPNGTCFTSYRRRNWNFHQNNIKGWYISYRCNLEKKNSDVNYVVTKQ